MNIVNVGYDSTNYYVLADAAPKLLIDVGFPGTLPKLQAQCKRMGVKLAELKYFVATHYHPDHAGMAQELKRTGVKLIVLETQIEAIPLMATYMKPQQHYLPIELGDHVMLTLAESRVFLAKLGIAGEFLSTPGHSDDSVALILDDGSAFTGDLMYPMMSEDSPDSNFATLGRVGKTSRRMAASAFIRGMGQCAILIWWRCVAEVIGASCFTRPDTSQC